MLFEREKAKIWMCYCPSSLHTIPRYIVSEAGKLYFTLSLLYNARFINNKTVIMKTYFAEQNVDRACVTKTWVQEGKRVTIMKLVPPGFSALQQSQTRGQEGVAFSVQ